MRQRVDNKRIEKFFVDRDILQNYNDVDIAKKMGVDKSNYSSYVNRRKPITNAFLNKFYYAFEEEIKETLERRQASAREKEWPYAKTEHPGKLNIESDEKIKSLETKYDRILESHQKISLALSYLEQKMDQILEESIEKIATLLSRLLDRQNESTDAIPTHKKTKYKHKKKPGG